MTRRSEADLIDEALRLRDMDATEVGAAVRAIHAAATDPADFARLMAAIRPEVRCTTTQPADQRATPRWEK